jgi:hypothetical protein
MADVVNAVVERNSRLVGIGINLDAFQFTGELGGLQTDILWATTKTPESNVFSWHIMSTHN